MTDVLTNVLIVPIHRDGADGAPDAVTGEK